MKCTFLPGMEYISLEFGGPELNQYLSLDNIIQIQGNSAWGTGSGLEDYSFHRSGIGPKGDHAQGDPAQQIAEALWVCKTLSKGSVCHPRLHHPQHEASSPNL